MASVTQRIAQIKQPRGGYLKPSAFEVTNLNDGIVLHENENVHPSIVGLAVDYMSRFMLTNDVAESFIISIFGATMCGQLDKAANLLNNIVGLDDNSIICACKMVGYDVVYRAGIQYFSNVEHIIPNKETISNIRIMIQRSLSFFQEFGPVTTEGFSFEGAYTDLINSGDGDFLTKDTLWDFKVSKNAPSSKYTLQILVYYIMGTHSIYDYFDNIKFLGLFNPRLNNVYTYSIENIDKKIIDIIAKDVIGY